MAKHKCEKHKGLKPTTQDARPRRSRKRCGGCGQYFTRWVLTVSQENPGH